MFDWLKEKFGIGYKMPDNVKELLSLLETNSTKDTDLARFEELLPCIYYETDYNHRRYADRAIQSAIQFGHDKHLKLMLSRGLQPRFSDLNFYESLELAESRGHNECIELIRRIVDDVDPSAHSIIPSLCQLIESRNFKMATFLVNHGAKVSVSNFQGLRPLYLVCTIDRDQFIAERYILARQLIYKNANIDLDSFFTVLRLGDEDIAELLINNTSYAKAINRSGDNSLTSSSKGGKYKTTKLLISKGADIHHVDNRGNTALSNAVYFQHNDYYKVAELLLNAGSNVNHVNNDGHTVLMLAAMRGNIEMVKLLISKGADINHVNEDGINALLLASQAGKLEMAEFLISIGAKAHLGNDPLEYNLLKYKSIEKYIIKNPDDITKIIKSLEDWLKRAKENGEYNDYISFESILNDEPVDMLLGVQPDGTYSAEAISLGNGGENLKALIHHNIKSGTPTGPYGSKVVAISRGYAFGDLIKNIESIILKYSKEDPNKSRKHSM